MSFGQATPVSGTYSYVVTLGGFGNAAQPAARAAPPAASIWFQFICLHVARFTN